METHRLAMIKPVWITSTSKAPVFPQTTNGSANMTPHNLLILRRLDAQDSTSSCQKTSRNMEISPPPSRQARA